MYHVDVTHLQAFMYFSVNGAFRYGIMAPFHRPQPDPPPPQLRQPPYHLQEIQDSEQLTPYISPRGGPLAASASRNQIQQRRTSRPQEKAAKVVVRTLRSGDDTNAQLCDAEPSLSAESDSEEPLQSPEALPGAIANAEANQTRTQDDATDSNAPQSQTKQVTVNKKVSKNEAGKVSRANKPPAGEQPSQAHIQVMPFSVKSDICGSCSHIIRFFFFFMAIKPSVLFIAASSLQWEGFHKP